MGRATAPSLVGGHRSSARGREADPLQWRIPQVPNLKKIRYRLGDALPDSGERRRPWPTPKPTKAPKPTPTPWIHGPGGSDQREAGGVHASRSVAELIRRSRSTANEGPMVRRDEARQPRHGPATRGACPRQPPGPGRGARSAWRGRSSWASGCRLAAGRSSSVPRPSGSGAMNPSESLGHHRLASVKGVHDPQLRGHPDGPVRDRPALGMTPMTSPPVSSAASARAPIKPDPPGHLRRQDRCCRAGEARAHGPGQGAG